MSYLERSYCEEILNRTEDIDAIDFSRNDLEIAIDQVVDVELPEGNPEIREITGPSFDEAIRDIPVTAQVDLRDVLKGTSAVIAGVAISNLFLKGLVLLLFFAAVALPETESVAPNQALAYGVAWDASENGITPVKKSLLVENTVEQSKDIDEVAEMSKRDVEDCIKDLQEKECITVESSSEGMLIWVNERFSVEY